ncbi:sulfatase [Candidatus Neomarinimicrobiota bacterium]
MMKVLGTGIRQGKNEGEKNKEPGTIHSLKRWQFIRLLGVGTAALALPGCAGLLPGCAGRRKHPNILYIMSDDHASTAISCYGGRLAGVAPTPNIDRLATEGLRLENCFCTNSICVPSRAAIMTGQYSHINGVYTLSDVFDRDRQNVTKMLQAAGYQTAVIGKWHLKTEPSGFDHYHVLPGQGRYHDPVMKVKGMSWQDGNRGGEVRKGYVTDVITDFSLDWLRNCDPDQPFFLMCHYKAVHEPWHYAERHKDLFKDLEIPEPPSLWEDKSHRSPGSREYGYTIETIGERFGRENWPTGRLDTSDLTPEGRRKAAYQKYLKDYLRCVAGIDENVGRLLEYLDRAGLSEDTVVIYTSDQGMFLGEHNYIDKRWIFEESLRMPFLVRYPREIGPGTTNSDIVLNIDFAPLFLDYAGETIPPDMQGHSFRPNTVGGTSPNWRRSMYYRYWQHTTRPAHYGVRSERYKLIFFYGLPLNMKGADAEPTKVGWELYNLEMDPQELHNVYNDPAYASVVRELKADLLRLKRELGDRDEKYPELMRLRREHWN